MQENYKIASIVVTYNGEKWILRCLESLRNSNIKNHKIFTVDNGSTDNTLTIIRENFPAVEIIETGENLGFGKANNIGIKKALKENYEYIFLLNQDAWLLEKEDLAKLVEAFNQNPALGICSPMQFKNESKLDLNFYNYLKRYSPVFLNKFLKGQFEPIIYPVKFINAASWLISKNCIKSCGIFAPVFDHYGEDTNYSERIRYFGFKSGVLPSVKLIHDRPQENLVDLDRTRYKKRLKMMAVSFLMNINYSSFRQFLLLMGTMIAKSIKNIISLRINKILSPLSATVFALLKFRLIIQLRKESKKGQAFL